MKTLILKLVYVISLFGAINCQAYPEISFISKEKGKIEVFSVADARF